MLTKPSNARAVSDRRASITSDWIAGLDGDDLLSGDAGDDAVVGDNVGRADDYLRATNGDEVRRAA